MYLRPLFIYLKKFFKNRIVLSFSRIATIIGKPLCNSAKETTWYWNSKNIKALKQFYGIKVVSVNPISSNVEFEIL